MLYVYYGKNKNIDLARAKVQATVTKMLSKNPDALYFHVTADSLDVYNIDELVYSQGLFKSEYIIVLDTLLSTTEGEKMVMDNLEKLADSSHPIFLLDTDLHAPVRKKIEKYASNIHEFTHTVKSTGTSFNIFALTDALAEKNIKKLWVLFREAKYNGVSDDEVHGVLFWMLKSISLAAQANNAKEAGMKEYPFSRAKKALARFTHIEYINSMLMELVLLPQLTRRNGGTLEYEIEKFILSLK